MPINTPPYIHEYVVCANVFVRKDGRYLMLKRLPKKQHAPNVLNPIGGKMDLGENPYIGAKREVLEEAGITVKNMRLEAVILEIMPHKDSPYNWLIFHFSADYDAGEVKQTEEGEFVMVTKEEILQQKENLFRAVREVIDRILNPNDGTVFATMMHDSEQQIITKTQIDLCAK